MRIISGKFRGKKINLPNDKTTRPLRDLVKEALFNVIEHSNKINVDLKNSVILDLFSGSGSFGLEAISRGAKKCLFVENYPSALLSLDKNIKNLKCQESSHLNKLDCFKFIESVQKNELKLHKCYKNAYKWAQFFFFFARVGSMCERLALNFPSFEDITHW